MLKKTTDPPIVDGIDTDQAWQSVDPLVVFDQVADRQIKVRGVYDAEKIYFLVSFSDPDESRLHKSWVWDQGRSQYVMGNMREDVFVFKWSMEKEPVDLSIHADDASRSDVWFWKANRTDPVGYADDKMHILSQIDSRDSTQVVSKTGRLMYLLRLEDAGRKAYEIDLLVDYVGDVRNRYKNEMPSLSRADVRAKGLWQKGSWTIEFSRALVTGHGDDLQFSNLNQSYQFGVSTLEIAGRKENPVLSEPLYGSGDIGEVIDLVFGGR
ncbi:MAG: hypothetical protein KKD73_07905 [Proteobacteria bacterium]|nr:hypothetical protein [Pseudomonadota bacterium]MBU1639550.1 hypothetical protein [Pseudomonadota bacterium]